MNRSFSGRKLVRVGQKVPDRKRTREKYDQQLKGKKPPKPNQTKKKNPQKTNLSSAEGIPGSSKCLHSQKLEGWGRISEMRLWRVRYHSLWLMKDKHRC
jgi:hypothetical protein